MAENSKIGWTDNTVNLWWGCTKVHTGCDNCYAEVLSHRFGDNIWGNDSPRKEIKSAFRDLNKYQKKARLENKMVKIFVGSMMDIFEKPMPLLDRDYLTGELRSRLFAQISRGEYPNLIFLFLTKRPSNINKYIPVAWRTNPPENVMFGTSPVDQKTAETLIPQLLEVKGKRFLSIEPQLGSINIKGFLFDGGINWVIQGGESGSKKRPFNLDWAYYMKQQCEETNVPFYFKQIDKVQKIPKDLMIKQFPKFLG